MDPLKPFEWIWMVVQLATNTVQMVSPCVYKTNGHFLKVEILNGFKWSISRRVKAYHTSFFWCFFLWFLWFRMEHLPVNWQQESEQVQPGQRRKVNTIHYLISFVWSQGQHLTLPFCIFFFVFISHLTNFLSYSVFMFVACLFLCHFAFEKEPARVRNVRPLTFILQLYSLKLVCIFMASRV